VLLPSKYSSCSDAFIDEKLKMKFYPLSSFFQFSAFLETVDGFEHKRS
jgi:hypothetical protein